MANEAEKKSLVVRMREFFEFKTAQDLMKEYQKLDMKDKEYFVEEFNKAGMPTVLTSAPSK